jgi:hypothetical protein
MIDATECIACGKVCPGGVWHPGEVCIYGSLFACSMACAEQWGREHAAQGHKPGQPGWRAEENQASDDVPTVTTQANPPEPIDWASKSPDEILAEVLALVRQIQAEPAVQSTDVHPDDLQALRETIPAAGPMLYATAVILGLPMRPSDDVPRGMVLMHMSDGSVRWLEIRAGAAKAAGLGPVEDWHEAQVRP